MVPTAKVERVTPEMAQALLQDHVNYRKLRPGRVAKYAGDMQRGEWTIGSTSIGIDINGKLTNGQHRLHALVQYGAPVDLMVTRGLSPDSLMDEDQVMARTFNDILRANGESDASTLAAVTRVLYMYRESGQFNERGATTPTAHELEALLRTNPDVRAAIPWGGRVNAQCKGIVKSLASTLYYLCSQTDAETAEHFFVAVASGIGLDPYSPVHALRRQLLHRPARGARLPHNITGALVIKAYNAYAQGTSVKVLAWKPAIEPFPPIYGAGDRQLVG